MSTRAQPNYPVSQSLGGLMTVLVVGIVSAIVAAAFANFGGWYGAVGVCLFIFLGAFAVGALLGFVFGVPRMSVEAPTVDPNTAANATSPASADRTAQGATAADINRPARKRLLQSNTNLEKISDWLTTLLVGAGLVQLNNIDDALYRFRLLLEENVRLFDSAGVQNAGVVPIIGPIILIFGTTCGFLYMYLMTRLIVTRLLQAVEGVLDGQSDETLPPDARKQVTMAVGSSNLGSFLSNSVGAKTSVRDAMNLMLDLLYKEEPQRVIDIGASISKTNAINSAKYWFYLALAFGQQHKKAETAADRSSSRENAFDCMRRAIVIDEDYRNTFWSYADPQSSENDLSDFREDEEFKQLTNRVL